MKRGEELEKNEDRETKRWKQAQQISREMRFGRKSKVLPMSRTILIKQGEAEDKA
jgi:hypothetical protein